MSNLISSLSTELLQDIAELLEGQSDQQALCSWSWTSSFYRLLLVSYVFRTIRLSNNEESGLAWSTFRGSYCSESVGELKYAGITPNPITKDEGNEYSFRHCKYPSTQCP